MRDEERSTTSDAKRADVGERARDSLGTAESGTDGGVPADLRDTWNTPEKEWHRPEPGADPFEDLGREEIDLDRSRYSKRSGI